LQPPGQPWMDRNLRSHFSRLASLATPTCSGRRWNGTSFS
jgi:hypothetical protein